MRGLFSPRHFCAVWAAFVAVLYAGKAVLFITKSIQEAKINDANN